MSVLITERDFTTRLGLSPARAADNVRHVEMFFDPQGHTGAASHSRPWSKDCTAPRRAQAKLGVEASLIMCFLRHLDEADAERRSTRAGSGQDRRRRARFVRARAPAEQVPRCSTRSDAGFFLARMPARKDRRATSGRRSTCSASRASITATLARDGAGRAARARANPAHRVSAVQCAAGVVDDLAHHPMRRMMDAAYGHGQFRRSRLFRRLCERELPRGVATRWGSARRDRGDRPQRDQGFADDAGGEGQALAEVDRVLAETA